MPLMVIETDEVTDTYIGKSCGVTDGRLCIGENKNIPDYHVEKSRTSENYRLYTHISYDDLRQINDRIVLRKIH